MKPASLVMVACAVAALFGCAGRKGPRACEPVPVEFFKAGGPVYRDCDVDRKVTPPTRISVPPGFQPRQACGHVSILVVIDTTGLPIRETAKVARSNDSQMEQLMLAMLTDSRYGPAMKNGAKVRQLYTFDMRYSMTVVAAGTPSAAARGQAPRSC